MLTAVEKKWTQRHKQSFRVWFVIRRGCDGSQASSFASKGSDRNPRGCTIRSLTHHLALYSASEINAQWHGPFAPAKDRLEVFNLLLLPWPTGVSASDLCTALVNQTQGSSVDEIFGYPDNLKFHSSMTLFEQAAEDDSVFEAALRKYFGGKRDPETIRRL